MIKFAGMSDPHLKGIRPRSRIDDYPATSKKKMAEFIETGHAHDVDFFLVGGDFFDSPYATPQYVIEIGQFVEELLQGKPMFLVLGNHDIIGYAPHTIKSTAYGVFLSFVKNVTLLEPTPTRYEFAGGAVYLSGVHAYAQLDRTLEHDGIELHRSRDYVIEDTLDAPSVHVVHGFLSPKPILDDIPHTLISEMAHTKATITMTGHDHTGFAPVETAGGLAYNPGAATRIHATETELRRTPEFAIISLDPDVPGYAPHIERIPFRSALPGDQVFDMERIQEESMQKALLASIQGNLSTALSHPSVDITSLTLKDLFERLQTDTTPAIFNEAKQRIFGNHT